MFRAHPGSNLFGAEKKTYAEIKAMVKQATNKSLNAPDWAANMACVDLISNARSPNVLSQVCCLIIKKLQVRQTITVIGTLVLVEALVKNCGTLFHNAVNEPEFIKEIGNFARRYYAAKDSESKVVCDLVLNIIQTWGEGFLPQQEKFVNIVRLYNELRRDGLPFKESDGQSRIPLFTPINTSPAPMPSNLVTARLSCSTSTTTTTTSTARLSSPRSTQGAMSIANGQQQQQSDAVDSDADAVLLAVLAASMDDDNGQMCSLLSSSSSHGGSFSTQSSPVAARGPARASLNEVQGVVVESMSSGQLADALTASVSLLSDILLACSGAAAVKDNELVQETVQQIRKHLTQLDSIIAHDAVHAPENIERWFQINDDSCQILARFDQLVQDNDNNFLSSGTNLSTSKTTTTDSIVDNAYSVSCLSSSSTGMYFPGAFDLPAAHARDDAHLAQPLAYNLPNSATAAPTSSIDLFAIFGPRKEVVPIVAASTTTSQPEYCQLYQATNSLTISLSNVAMEVDDATAVIGCVEDDCIVQVQKSQIPFAESIAFPCRGVRVTALREFVEKCGGEAVLAQLTTSEVCKQFIKSKAIFVSEESYCDYLASQETQSSASVGIATVFISHAWGCEFMAVVRAIEDHFASLEVDHLCAAQDVFIWFDLLSYNQFTTIELSHHWLSTTLKSAIQQIGHTMLIVSPWNGFLPLNRTWCLYEIFCTVASGGRLDVAMSGDERTQFVSEIIQSCDLFNNLLASVNVEHSCATKVSDWIKISAAVNVTAGVTAFNSTVVIAIRQWLIDTIAGHVETMSGLTVDVIIAQWKEFDFATTLSLPTLKTLVNMLVTLARFYSINGRPDMAEALYVQALDMSSTLLHSEPTCTLNSLANLYYAQGDFVLAEPLYVKCLHLRTRQLGGRHPKVLQSMNNLGYLFFSQGRYLEAEQLFAECMQLRQEQLGVCHPDALVSVSNLAYLYKFLGRFDKAQQLYLSCYESRKSILGDDHPTTLSSMNNLALVYLESGCFELAEPLLVHCLETRQLNLGTDHESTLISMNNLAGLYAAQGRRHLAEPLYAVCLERKLSKLGEHHVSTQISARSLSVIRQTQN